MGNNPKFIQDPNFQYDAQDWRIMLGVLFKEGVLDAGAGQLLVTPRATAANMSVDVAAGYAVVAGDTVTEQGSYLHKFVAVNRTIQAPPSSGSRIDLVVGRILDAQVTGSGQSGADIQVITGAAGSSPVAPVLPATAILLAEVRVTAAATAITAGNITDKRSQIGAAELRVGTQHQPMSAAQRSQLSPYVGQTIFNTTVGRNETYLGSTLGWSASSGADVRIFTASGTWTKPAGAAMVFVDIIGGGAGGGGGTHSSGELYPSFGGGGGGRRQVFMAAEFVPATVSVTVGGGAGGGTGQGSGTAGVGGTGGTSLFGSMAASGGLGGTGAAPNTQGIPSGSGGSNAGYGVGNVTASNGQYAFGPLGGAVSSNGQGGLAEWGGGGGARYGPGGNSANGAGGGGGGGYASNAGYNGGGVGNVTGAWYGSPLGGAAAGTDTNGEPGGAGQSYVFGNCGAGGAGGGGAPSTGFSGGNGGNGGVPGGGGGGGGSITSGRGVGGTGGNGGRGEVRVITIYG